MKLRPYKEKIDQIISLLGELTSLQLEMYATTHFIASALYETYSISEPDMIIHEVRQAKGAKFTKDQIRKAFDDMVEWGLLKSA